MDSLLKDEKYTKLIEDLTSGDKVLRTDAYNTLWSEEENGIIQSEHIVEILNDNYPEIVYSYALDALGRFKSHETYPHLKKFLLKADSPMLLDQIMKTINIINDPYFVDCVLDKMGFTGTLKMRSEPHPKNKYHDFIATSALEYFSNHVSKKLLPVVSYYLKHKSSVLRFKSLMIIKNGMPDFDESVLRDLAANDPGQSNRSMAQYILDMKKEPEN